MGLLIKDVSLQNKFPEKLKIRMKLLLLFLLFLSGEIFSLHFNFGLPQITLQVYISLENS